MRRIKKGIAVALSLVLALSLTACGTKKSAEKNELLIRMVFHTHRCWL